MANTLFALETNRLITNIDKYNLLLTINLNILQHIFRNKNKTMLKRNGSYKGMLLKTEKTFELK
jgi:hypothetical protein